MDVKIKLDPEAHDALLGQLPPGLAVYRVLSNAKLIRSYVSKAPVEYEVDCDEDVAQTLLWFAKRHYPEAVTEIDFALRLARSKEKQPPLRSLFRK